MKKILCKDILVPYPGCKNCFGCSYFREVGRTNIHVTYKCMEEEILIEIEKLISIISGRLAELVKAPDC